MGFLTDIATQSRTSLARSPLDAEALRAEAAEAPEARNLAWVLRGYAEEDGIAVIAEVKRASPSAGPIAPEADPVLQAMSYDVGGAAAISVLTEPEHFGGSLDDLRAVRRAVEHPVLRKDFLVHRDQVTEARAAGADSVLLITACLPGRELDAMIAAARDFGMEPLVEAHSDEDLDRAIEAGAEVIGVNSRDLESLEVDLEAALERVARVPADRLAVLESGISSAAHVRAAVEAGASAILVGETLMRADDPARMLRELISAGRKERS
jgi:indole-3-glycerol phosphate synthase